MRKMPSLENVKEKGKVGFISELPGYQRRKAKKMREFIFQTIRNPIK